MSWFNSAWLVSVAACVVLGCDRSAPEPEQASGSDAATSPPAAMTKQGDGELKRAAHPTVAAARSQIGKTVTYDSSYVALQYPGGDVAIERGVCTDVVIRALRDALGMDLQKLVHEDMSAAFSEYPTIWGLKKPDRNIDHRRVPNLRRYFERKGYSLGVSRRKEDYLPGDIATCTVGPNRPHIMVVSDREAGNGVPLVIHNIGRGAREEDRLFDFPITGHYRISPQRLSWNSNRIRIPSLILRDPTSQSHFCRGKAAARSISKVLLGRTRGWNL